MGAWSTSITGNDTAQDLRTEYTCAFFKYEPDEGVKLLDEYVKREHIADEHDETEWCNYVYSLADFMWKKGILTDEIKERALNMIDSGYGLEIWADAGEKTLNERKKSLEKFREKITSPQPEKKKIKPQVHTEDIFRNGELIAVKLITSDKVYTKLAYDRRPLSQEEFKALDGKYILMQKIQCHSSWHSAILPEINDYWAIFRLFDGVYDEIPEINDISVLKDAVFIESFTPLFLCESSMFYFRKRKYKIIGYFPEGLKKFSDAAKEHISFGVNREWTNPDSDLVAAMGKGDAPVVEEYDGSLDDYINKACVIQYFYSKYYSLNREEAQKKQDEIEEQIKEHIELTKKEGGKFYLLKFGAVAGFGSVTGSKIDDFFVFFAYRRNGFSDILLKRLMEIAGEDAHMDIPDIRTREKLITLCKRVGLKYNLL